MKNFKCVLFVFAFLMLGATQGVMAQDKKEVTSTQKEAALKKRANVETKSMDELLAGYEAKIAKQQEALKAERAELAEMKKEEKISEADAKLKEEAIAKKEERLAAKLKKIQMKKKELGIEKKKG